MNKIMTLHVFDSCPFCTRVKTFIGLKGIDCEILPMLLGEPPQVLSKLKRLTVPVLETKELESGDIQLKVESLDIIETLDQISEPLLTEYSVSKKIESRLALLIPITANLLYPRMPRLNLPELSSDLAMSLFAESRKEALGQSLEHALENTEYYLPELEKQLVLFEQELDVDSFLNGRRELILDDIAAFSELRNYTMIGELKMSNALETYIYIISSRSNVAIYPPINQ